VYDSIVLTRIINPREGRVITGWRRLHYEQLHDLYFSMNISIIMGINL
jgi:hypothetical protein